MTDILYHKRDRKVRWAKNAENWPRSRCWKRTVRMSIAVVGLRCRRLVGVRQYVTAIWDAHRLSFRHPSVPLSVCPSVALSRSSFDDAFPLQPFADNSSCNSLFNWKTIIVLQRKPVETGRRRGSFPEPPDVCRTPLSHEKILFLYFAVHFTAKPIIFIKLTSILRRFSSTNLTIPWMNGCIQFSLPEPFLSCSRNC